MDQGGRSESGIGDVDLHLFNEGTHVRLYEKFGAHLHREGVRFAVWAPNAERVSVIGDWNGWDDRAHPMTALGSSGVWTADVAGLGRVIDHVRHSPAGTHRQRISEKLRQPGNRVFS